MEPHKTIARITQDLLNLIMLRERDFFLKSDDSEENKSKGFYGRNFACMFGNLNLNIPRDRLGKFRPAILQKEWQRFDRDFQNFLLNLILQSYSTSRIRSFLPSLNLPYSPNEIEQLKEKLYSYAKKLRTKELTSDCFSLIIDAYHTDHQLCFVHMQRNVFRNMSKSDAEKFNATLAKIKLLSDYEEAVKEFESLCSRYEKKYPAYIKMRDYSLKLCKYTTPPKKFANIAKKAL